MELLGLYIAGLPPADVVEGWEFCKDLVSLYSRSFATPSNEKYFNDALKQSDYDRYESDIEELYSHLSNEYQRERCEARNNDAYKTQHTLRGLNLMYGANG